MISFPELLFYNTICFIESDCRERDSGYMVDLEKGNYENYLQAARDNAAASEIGSRIIYFVRALALKLFIY